MHPALTHYGAPVTLYRQTAGAWVSGRHQAGAEQAIAITAIIQPADGRDLQRLPEGLRAEAIVRVDTDAPLVLEPPDQLEHDGARWQLEHVEDWTRHGGLWMGLARRMP